MTDSTAPTETTDGPNFLIRAKNVFRKLSYGVIGTAVTVMLLTCGYKYGTITYVTAKITNAETSNGELVIYTSAETLRNVPSVFHFKGTRASADLQGKAIANETMKFKVYGKRIPFLVSYRNVIAITAVEAPAVEVPAESTDTPADKVTAPPAELPKADASSDATSNEI